MRIVATLHRSFTGGVETHSVSGRNLVLIISADCHLCEHARSVLEALGLRAREIDVGGAEAQSLADAGVPLAVLPVLWDGERVLGYGRLSERALRRKLAL